MQPCWPQHCPWEENVSGQLYFLLSVFPSVLVVAIADLSSSLGSGPSLLLSQVGMLRRSRWGCPSAGFGLEPGEDASTVMSRQRRANITLHFGFGKHWAVFGYRIRASYCMALAQPCCPRGRVIWDCITGLKAPVPGGSPSPCSLLCEWMEVALNAQHHCGQKE